MILADTNVLLDVVTGDATWADWSLHRLEAAVLGGPVIINDIVYAELSVGFSAIEAVNAVIEDAGIELVSMPREALFLAGKVFRRYRAQGGAKTSVLPDFFIGAHATVLGIALLTRDARRYRTYFPGLRLIAP
jgi:predicted nucleic acid-binding protein